MPKPITALTITLLLFAISLISCIDKSKNDEKLISALQRSLIASSHTINLSTETLLKGLEEKSLDYCTKERAEVWFPKAKLISKSTKELYDYFESIKQRNPMHDSGYTAIINKLSTYREVVLLADSSIMKEFHDNFQFISRIKDENLDNIPEGSEIAILCMLQNEIKNIENKTIAFCNTKVGCNIMFFDVYAPIIGQNSNYLKPGSKLEITAGVGAFSKTVANPIITINNKNMELEPEGFSLYKMKVPEVPGNYKVPVRIKYFNEAIRIEEERSIYVEYTVAKPCEN